MRPDKPCICVVLCLFLILVISLFWFGDRILVLVVLVPGHCSSFPSQYISLLQLKLGDKLKLIHVQPIELF